ncbi:MAG: hypothetical protein ABIS03_03270, partial [Gemmatimonadaceae bacterium]
MLIPPPSGTATNRATKRRFRISVVILAAAALAFTLSQYTPYRFLADSKTDTLWGFFFGVVS